MMEREIEGIVLSTSEYREHDGLLTILTEEDKKIRFVARGIQKITSKNAGALLIGAQSLFLLQVSALFVLVDFGVGLQQSFLNVRRYLFVGAEAHGVGGTTGCQRTE